MQLASYNTVAHSGWLKLGLMMAHVVGFCISCVFCVLCMSPPGKQGPGLDHWMAARLPCTGNLIPGRVPRAQSPAVFRFNHSSGDSLFSQTKKI